MKEDKNCILNKKEKLKVVVTSKIDKIYRLVFSYTKNQFDAKVMDCSVFFLRPNRPFTFPFILRSVSPSTLYF